MNTTSYLQNREAFVIAARRPHEIPTKRTNTSTSITITRQEKCAAYSAIVATLCLETPARTSRHSKTPSCTCSSIGLIQLLIRERLGAQLTLRWLGFLEAWNLDFHAVQC